MNPRKVSREGRETFASDSGMDGDDINLVTQYFADVSKHHLITSGMEKILGEQVKEKDQNAVNALAKANLRFVVSVAKKYQGRGVPLIDLIQDGNVGLMTAAEKFDPDQNVKFISYAVWWIRQSILAALAKVGRPVKIPLNRSVEISKVYRASEELKNTLGRDPTLKEISDHSGISEGRVSHLQSLNLAEIRLDSPIAEGEDAELIERFMQEEAIDPEEDIEKSLLARAVSEAIQTLTGRDAKIVCLYYGLDGHRSHTLEEIGNDMNISRERVRQIRDRAVGRIRDSEHSETLRSFL